MSDAPGLFSDGAAYERLMGRWSRLVARPFLDWLALPAGQRCLDVGCGNGAFTEELISRLAPMETVGVDLSEGQLAYARSRPDAKLATFQIGDAQALSFADHSFDAALMALVISFVPDPAKAVREMVRVVRPGGCVAAYMWDIPGGGLPLEPIHVAMQSMGLEPPNPPGFAVSKAERLRKLWQQAGLGSVETRVIHIPVEYADFDDFWASNNVPIGPASQAIQRMPPDAQQQLKAMLREQLPVGADGRIVYRAFANAVKGRVPGQ